MKKHYFQILTALPHPNGFETVIYEPFDHRKHVIIFNCDIKIELYAERNTIKPPVESCGRSE